jgi:SNF2 family DNA or RNA helicase
MLKEALSQMAHVFLPAVLMRGQEYQQKGHVLNVRLSEGLLKARVKGHASQIYDVHIDLKIWPKKPAQCSCPYQVNCKHAVASLLYIQVRDNLVIPPPMHEETSQSLEDWLTTLRSRTEVSIPRDHSHEIAYLIEPQFNDYEHRLIIRLAVAKRRKKGGLGKKVVFTSVSGNRKQYFSAKDDAIIPALLKKNSVQLWFERLTLRNSELLQEILNSERAYLAESPEQKLIMGEPRNAQVAWRLTPQGTQFAVLESGGETILPLFLDRVWYFDREHHALGLVMIPYDLAYVKRVLNRPAVSFIEAGALAMQMALMHSDIPPPKVYEDKVLRNIPPKAIIQFDAIEVAAKFSSTHGLEQSFLFLADVFFDYEGIRIAKDEILAQVIKEEGQILIEMPRNHALEKEMFNEIGQILALRSATVSEKLACEQDALKHKQILAYFHSEADLPRLYNQILPLLERQGYKIEFVHPVYKEVIDAEEIEWYSDAEESGNDFFSYQLGILIDGKQVSIVPLVAELISKLRGGNLDDLPNETLLKMPLANGKLLQLKLGRIKPLIQFLLQYGARHIKNQHEVQISRYQLILMQETELALAAVSGRWRGAETIRNQLSQLTTLDNLPQIAIPRGLKTTLRDYQQEGLNWLQFLRYSQFGGVLADDMGLGKTVQTLAHLQVEKEQGRLDRASLIIAPTSLIVNWFEEAKRFTPTLKFLIFHGAGRHEDDFVHYDVIISTYGLIQRDKSRFINYAFYYLILDESQSIKNARTKTTQIIQQIKATHRLCLSGTPLENHLGELWSLFHFLMPGLLGEARQFRQFFKNPIEKKLDVARRQLLARRVQPFILRRSKNQVARELPDKTEMTRKIELMGPQRDLYEAIRMSMEKKVREAIFKRGMEKSHIILLDALLKLRQVCCDPKLLTLSEAKMAYGYSAKLDTLMELLESLISEGRRILVFSQFTSMLKLIEEELIRRNFAYLKLTGQTQNRQNLVNQFQQGHIPVFLISLKAGGTGLNLTRADTVIHYDPWWNPAVEDQATDRSHRIGQENPVFVYKLITSGTVEEAILAMQNKKRALFDGILSDNVSGMAYLSDKDIEQFFMPLSNE